MGKIKNLLSSLGLVVVLVVLLPILGFIAVPMYIGYLYYLIEQSKDNK
jgi:hypothetical protein